MTQFLQKKIARRSALSMDTDNTGLTSLKEKQRANA
jgi:hypothetical protein